MILLQKLRKEMANVIGELRIQIEAVQRSLARACEAGLTYEAQLHHARLEDLLEMAARHGIDAGTWVDRSQLTRPDRVEG